MSVSMLYRRGKVRGLGNGWRRGDLYSGIKWSIYTEKLGNLYRTCIPHRDREALA